MNFFRLRLARQRRFGLCAAAAAWLCGSLLIAAPPRGLRPGTAPSSRRPATAAPQPAAKQPAAAPQTVVKPNVGGNAFAPPPLPENTTGKKPQPVALPPTPPPPQREPAKNVATYVDADGKYLLRYHFSAGETIRWQVEHAAKIVTSVQGSTQTAETVTESRKAWRVVETLPGGEARFIHSVEAIRMKQKLTGRQETAYDSEVDREPPPIFAEAAKQIGVPLAEITIDARGQVLRREDKLKRPEGSPTNTITLVLPDKPLAIGESWTAPFELKAHDADGKPKTIAARNKLTLERVEEGTAVIKSETLILSPLTDPAIEAQVVQSEQSGRVWFDLRSGRIVKQESDLDKEVFGFQGPESKLHYTARFRESLGTAPKPLTAEKPKPQPTTK